MPTCRSAKMKGTAKIPPGESAREVVACMDRLLDEFSHRLQEVGAELRVASFEDV